MRFSGSFLEELRARIDIEELVGRYTEIKHRGSKRPVARCPFHTEKTPSFVIYPETQSYYCYGCGVGGDAVTFVRNAERLDYVDAVRYLCEKAGMLMPTDTKDDEYNKLRRKCFEANREAAKFFYSCLFLPQGENARAYLQKRRLSIDTVKHFGLGYAPDSWDSLIKHLNGKGFTNEELLAFDLAKKTAKGNIIDAFRNRLMFPIIDIRGNVIAFGGRVLDDSKPKYLNTSDTVVFKKSQHLYALNFAKNNSDKRLILCEGYMDVIAMHQAGFTNAVAGLGTAFTSDHISLLSRYCDELTLCFDSDEAGVKATKRALSLLSNSTMKIKVMSLDTGKDPDEIIQTQGKGKMIGIIENAVNNTEFTLNDIRKKYDIKSEDGKLGFLNEAIKILAELNNAIEKDLYIAKLSTELDVDKNAIAVQVAKHKRLLKKQDKQKEFTMAKDMLEGKQSVSGQNPQVRGNVKAVKAEEIILASLLKHPDYLKRLSKELSADVFVTDFNKSFFDSICKRIQNDDSVELYAFGEESDSKEMSYLSYLLAKGADISNSLDECRQCIQVLLTEKNRTKMTEVGKLSSEEYLELFNKIRSKKSTEG